MVNATELQAILGADADQYVVTVVDRAYLESNKENGEALIRGGRDFIESTLTDPTQLDSPENLIGNVGRSEGKNSEQWVVVQRKDTGEIVAAHNFCTHQFDTPRPLQEPTPGISQDSIPLVDGSVVTVYDEFRGRDASENAKLQGFLREAVAAVTAEKVSLQDDHVAVALVEIPAVVFSTAGSAKTAEEQERRYLGTREAPGPYQSADMRYQQPDVNKANGKHPANGCLLGVAVVRRQDGKPEIAQIEGDQQGTPLQVSKGVLNESLEGGFFPSSFPEKTTKGSPNDRHNPTRFMAEDLQGEGNIGLRPNEQMIGYREQVMSTLEQDSAHIRSNAIVGDYFSAETIPLLGGPKQAAGYGYVLPAVAHRAGFEQNHGHILDGVRQALGNIRHLVLHDRETWRPTPGTQRSDGMER